MRTDKALPQNARGCLKRFGLSPRETDLKTLEKIKHYIRVNENKINSAYAEASCSNFERGKTGNVMHESYSYLRNIKEGKLGFDDTSPKKVQNRIVHRSCDNLVDIREEKLILDDRLPKKVQDILTKCYDGNDSKTIDLTDFSLDEQKSLFHNISWNGKLRNKLNDHKLSFNNIKVDFDFSLKYGNPPFRDNLHRVQVALPPSSIYAKYTSIDHSSLVFTIDFAHLSQRQDEVFQSLIADHVAEASLRYDKIKFENVTIDNALITKYADNDEKDANHILRNIRNAIVMLPISYDNLHEIRSVKKEYNTNAIRDITHYADVTMAGDKMQIAFKKNSTAEEQEKVFRFIEKNSILKKNLSNNKIEFSNVAITQSFIDTRGYRRSRSCGHRLVQQQEQDRYDAHGRPVYRMQVCGGNPDFKPSRLLENVKSATVAQNIQTPEEVLKIAGSHEKYSFVNRLLRNTEIIETPEEVLKIAGSRDKYSFVNRLLHNTEIIERGRVSMFQK